MQFFEYLMAYIVKMVSLFTIQIRSSSFQISQSMTRFFALDFYYVIVSESEARRNYLTKKLKANNLISLRINRLLAQNLATLTESSVYFILTKTIQCQVTRVTHYSGRTASNKGLTLEKSSLETLYGGQFTLSTQQLIRIKDL